MMILKWSFIFVALAASQTFPGFVPEATNPLVIEYFLNSTTPEYVSPDGRLMNMSVVASPPTIGTPLTLNLTPSTTGYLFLMIDSDVLLPSAPNITTILHFLLGNLTLPSTSPIVPTPDTSHFIVPPIMEINFTELIAPMNQTPIAPYMSPAPLPNQKHRYTFLLFEQPESFLGCQAPEWSCIPGGFQGFLPLEGGGDGMGRMGFNVSLFQEKAGIGEPVAGWFMEVESAPNAPIPTTNGTQLNVPNSTATSTATGNGASSSATATAATSAAASSTSASGGMMLSYMNVLMWFALGVLSVLFVF